MRIFTNQKKSPKGSVSASDLTTAQVFLGYPEAEAEVVDTAKIRLADVFDDYFDVLRELDGPKFIISGRKGSGKSAIGEYIGIRSAQSKEGSLFVEYVRQQDINYEKLLQAAQEIGADAEATAILEWLILVRFCQSLIGNEALKSKLPLKDLEKFFERNRGFVSLGAIDIKQITTTDAGQVSVGLFTKAMFSILSRKLEFKGGRAPFYKLIPHLRDAVFSLLSDRAVIENQAEYILIFDDLDIGLSTSNTGAMTQLAALIRLCKTYNYNFSNKKANAKIVVLLREDVVTELAQNDADMGKSMQSYCIRLSWYGPRVFGLDENNALIKRFIAKRISVCMKKYDVAIDNVSSAWDCLIYKGDAWGDKTSFKYVMDFTLYRPRDLILFFSEIDKLDFKLPLNRDEVDSVLAKNYSMRLVNEWSNELLFVMSRNDIEIAISILRSFALRNMIPFRLHEFTRAAGGRLEAEPDVVLKRLFEYGLIGEIDNRERLFFTYREDPLNPISFQRDATFAFQKGLLAYCNSAYSGR